MDGGFGGSTNFGSFAGIFGSCVFNCFGEVDDFSCLVGIFFGFVPRVLALP